MARKNRPHNQDSHEDRLLFENVELKDRIARGNTELRMLDRRIERLTRAGNQMYQELISRQAERSSLAEWEAAIK